MKIKIKTTILLALLPALLFSQEPLKHEKKIYISPDGKMFVNKALPVYLWLSTSEDPKASKFILKSETTKKYSNPMYFDTEGRNTIRSPWAVDTVTKMPVYPNQDIIFDVYTDSRPPISRVDFGKHYTFKKDNKIYCKQKLELNFKVFDEMSGVESLYYSINGVAYVKFTQPVELKEPMEYSIKYYAVDNVGNVEHIKNFVIVIDASNPKTTLNFSGDYYQNIFSSRASIEIKASDDLGIEGIYYQIDTNRVMPYTIPLKFILLKQGEHTLKYYSVDKVENREPENTYSFYYDNTPPTIVEELLGNSFMSNGVEYSSGRTKFKITSFDNKAGVKAIYYSLNGKDYQLYDKPFYLDASSGNMNISTYALDNVNNKSIDNSQADNHKASIPYIDLSGPSLNHTFIGPMFITRDTIFISNSTKIKLSAKDPESGVAKIEFSVDNSATQEYKEPYSIEKEGLHKISYTGTDNVNNFNQDNFVVITDNKGPEIFARYSIIPISKKVKDGKTIDIYPGHVILFLSGTDDYVGIEKIIYSINNQPEVLYNGLIQGFSTGKDYSVKVKAIDKLGNQTSKVFEFSTAL